MKKYKVIFRFNEITWLNDNISHMSSVSWFDFNFILYMLCEAFLGLFPPV